MIEKHEEVRRLTNEYREREIEKEKERERAENVCKKKE